MARIRILVDEGLVTKRMGYYSTGIILFCNYATQYRTLSKKQRSNVAKFIAKKSRLRR